MSNTWFPSRLRKTRFSDQPYSSQAAFDLHPTSFASVAEYAAAVNALSTSCRNDDLNSIATPYVADRLLSSPPIDLNTFKGIKFVSLYPWVLEMSELYERASGTFQWEICASLDIHCISYIRENCLGKRVFLVTSGGLGLKVVPQIHDLPQVYAIYVHCSDVAQHRAWAQNYAKVRVICDDDRKDLIPQLALDAGLTYLQWGDALFEKGTKDRARQNYEKAFKILRYYPANPEPKTIMAIQKKISSCG